MTAEERDEDQLRKLSMLAEPMRMRILRLLAANGSLRAKDILEEFSVTQPTLSHHMNILIDADLVRAQKDGRCIWYSINDPTVRSLADMLGELTDGSLAVSVTSEPSKTKKKAPSAAQKKASKAKPALKVDPSVPKPKTVVEVPDIEELKKKKDKKKKNDKKKKDKEKDKKKKK
ncbi:MAG: metalloregulator ArsR/SmtB family transcription factor [Saccharofermentans sp.]|nr:metalloregulator ArsR/SmtB family transcription factor [Saccharofermentans sp.]